MRWSQPNGTVGVAIIVRHLLFLLLSETDVKHTFFLNPFMHCYRTMPTVAKTGTVEMDIITVLVCSTLK